MTGASPVVDTQSTKSRPASTPKKLAALPNGSNDPWAMLAETPAVKMTRIDVGGSTSGTQTSLHRVRHRRPAAVLRRASTAPKAPTVNGNYVDMNAYDEVAVNTVGNNAEMGPPGVMMVFVVKSGGNTYHGSAGINYTDGDWQSFNIDADQIARGVEGGGGLEPRRHQPPDALPRQLRAAGRLHPRRTSCGGLARSANPRIRLRQTNFPVKPFETTLQVYQGKGTYQLTQNNKFIGYYQSNTKDQPNRLDRFQLNALNAIHPTTTRSSSSIKGLSCRRSSSTRSSATRCSSRSAPGSGATTEISPTKQPRRATRTRSTRIVSGAAQNRYDKPRRNQVLGSLSYFKEGLGGTHNLKFGWEIFRETDDRWVFMAGAYNDVVHILRNGAPLEVFLLGNPAESPEGLWNTGLYLTDTWRASNKLTLNLGLRFDRYRNFLSEQTHEADRFFPETVVFPAVDDVRDRGTWPRRAWASATT